MDSDNLPAVQNQPEHQLLGPRVHRFEAGGPRKKKRNWTVELLGILSALMVPVGLGWAKGTSGTIAAILGGIVAVACLLVLRRPQRRVSTVIELYENGVAVSQGQARRELVWNQVVEVWSRRLELAPGRISEVLVFEVACEPPLLIMVGGAVSDVKDGAALLATLERLWLPVWCRRARVWLEDARELKVGRVEMTLEGVRVGEKLLPWSEVTAGDKEPGSSLTVAGHAPDELDEAGANTPFPSTSARIAALAGAPPSPPLLPPARKV